MTQKSPLAAPEPWDWVSSGYVSEALPMFEQFAADALQLAEPLAGTDVVDVAAGPGSLSLLAAQSARHVTAVDFSSGMLAELERRRSERRLDNITALQGDGQALPLADGCCDRAFSMFGLIFFPDRLQGFRELWRILRPGGRAVVSSWVPFDRVPLMQLLFNSLAELMPELPFGKNKAPLGEPEEFESEMRAAGFEDVRVHHVAHSNWAASPQAFLQSALRSTAPLVLLKRKLPADAWTRLEQGLEQRFEQEHGTSPVTFEPVALLCVGHRH